jgi:hypothetical protein
MPTFSFPSSTVAVGAVGATTKKKAKMMAPKEDVDSHTATTATPEKNTHDTEEYAIQSEPTFPDVVILKQTDKNYIVKHNHYSLSHVKGSVAGDENPMSMSTNGIHSNSSTDLVSPNQIYKGQINKKRGRKPKAGILLNSTTGMYDTTEVPNIILHLKCHLSDLKSNDSISNFDYTPSINEVESYNLSTNMLKSSELSHSYHSDTNNDNGDDENVNDNDHNANNIHNNIYPQRDMNTTVIVPACLGPSSASGPAAGPSSAISVKKIANEANIHVINERHHKEVMKKINRLKYSFHNGDTIQMKLNHKCACFWDTCEFDGPIYYTPIMIVNGVFHVSGCYCSPECALASILKEQMDTSTKFERIHLLHLLYGTSKTTGFKPAPNPNYLLDKYYGNLTIEEYRSLLKGPQLIHVVNKPLTHILPELYEDNNDFLVNSKVIPTNTLKLKKRYKTTLVQNSATAD